MSKEARHFNSDVHNRIYEINSDSVRITTKYEDVSLKKEDVNNFITSNNIEDLEIYYDLDVYNFISVKIRELHICGIFSDIPWDKLIKFVKSGLVKRLNLILVVGYHEVNYLVELMKIPTLVAIKSMFDNNDVIKHKKCSRVILRQLEKSFHIVHFHVNTYDSKGLDRCQLIGRNIAIQNDIIHHHVLNFAIALCSFIDIGFDPYVLLEIFDQIGWNYLGNHVLKINIIQRVCEFRKRKLCNISN